LIIFIGIIIGFVGGLFLATLVYALQWREFRRRAELPRTPFSPRFRAIVHILIALVVGVVVGYHCSTPEYMSTMIVVPLTLLLGGIGSAYLELANPHSQTAQAAPHQTDLQDPGLKY
jgi:undecaprenyl pyrophosphate phosphatase UppP